MEKKMKNMKVSAKLKKAFSGILRMFILALLISVVSTSYMVIAFRSFYQKSYNASVVQLEIQRDVQMIGKLVLLALHTDDTAEANKYIGVINTKEIGIVENVGKLKETLNDKDMVARLETEITKLRYSISDMGKQLVIGNKDTALEIFDNAYYTASDAVQSVLNEVGAAANDMADSNYRWSTIIGIAGAVALIVIGVFSVLSSTKIIKVLSKLILEPLNIIKKVAGDMKEGILDTEVEYESEDEFGDVARDFAETCETLHTIIADAEYLLNEMGNGNFNVNTAKEDYYVGEFRGLILAMRKMNREMSKTLKLIDEVSVQVAMGAEQLADGAQSLAEGATEQAEAVDELVKNIAEVANISDNNASEAVGAVEMITGALNNAQKSQEDLKALTDAMNRISESSMKIQDIIMTIEDIAGQTNLLSLNASIEAARAGESGRGFAVVADQIGKLADDSAQSAVSTKELIEASLAEIQNGNEITERTVAAFEEILANMAAFAGAAKGSSEASKSQSVMLSHVENGIAQIEGVVQSNSSAAEETSATSEELSAQSANLKELVQRFVLREE